MSADDLHADLRLAVHGLRSTERGRSFAPMLHAGLLGGQEFERPLDAELDARDVGIRTDLALALVAGAREFSSHPAVWITRPGTPDPHDLDLRWVPVLHRVCGILEVEPRCVVVITKAGWLDPISGERAEWKRLRLRARELARRKDRAGRPGS